MTPCACGHGCARNTGCRSDGPTPRPAWTFETFHAPHCREHLQDPGARCVCRDWSPPKETK
jgi:hypothetical protein